MIPQYSITSTDVLSPLQGNPRIHTDAQIDQIAVSIKQFGFITPVVIDSQKHIFAGEGRYLAALKLGLGKIPTVQVSHLTEDEIRAYRLADNKISDNSEWDNDLLKIELSYLLEIDSEIDINSIGFSAAEIDVRTTDIDPDSVEEPPPLLPQPNETISRHGDIWLLENHRIGVGDCLNELFVQTILCGEFASMSCIDPPFNVPIQGHVSGKGKNKHNEFSMASGEMSSEEFIKFLVTALTLLYSTGKAGSLHYVFMDWRHLTELLTAGHQVFDQLINLCVWAKNNGGMGSLYRSQHELCLIFKKGTAPHINNVELGKHGRNRTNVWNYAGMNSFGVDRDELLAAHPTVKPVAMIADAIMDVTHHGDIVLDGFLGSGTTLIAAEHTHRICYGIEIDPRYVDVTLKRWMDETSGMPILETTGQTFDEIASERLNASEQQEANDE